MSYKHVFGAQPELFKSRPQADGSRRPFRSRAWGLYDNSDNNNDNNNYYTTTNNNKYYILYNVIYYNIT